jgi:3-oxoacyl-[acyl-carrier protein] reductase
MLKNKIALVSGASRGIGLAIALELGKHGATILGTATTEEGAKAITKILQEHQLQGTGLQLNINQKSGINDLVTTITERYGAPNILINNAAITCDNLVLRMKDEEWDNIINTNLSGAYYLTKACLKGMLKARWGRIINISSIVGVTGNAGQVNYAAAKAGLIGLTKSLALEIATRDITVNAVAPGFVDTDMTRKLSEDQRNDLLAKIPAHRFGHPDDIAHAVAFLASPFASYITGQTLHVNGGMYMN